MTGAAGAQYRDWRDQNVRRMRGEGASVEAIAAEVGCAERTVYDILGPTSDRGSAKISERDADIRRRAAAGETHQAIADGKGISQQRVSQIVNAPPAFVRQFDGDIDNSPLAECPECGETHRTTAKRRRRGSMRVSRQAVAAT
jgi:hypothetical protein